MKSSEQKIKQQRNIMNTAMNRTVQLLLCQICNPKIAGQGKLKPCLDHLLPPCPRNRLKSKLKQAVMFFHQCTKVN